MTLHEKAHEPSIWKRIPYALIFTILTAAAAWTYQYGQMTANVDALKEAVREDGKEIKELTRGVSRLQEGQDHLTRGLDRIVDRLDKVFERKHAQRVD